MKKPHGQADCLVSGRPGSRWSSLVTTAATSGAAGSTARSKAGGALPGRLGAVFGFTDSFDPTGEYLGDAFGIMSNLLVRTLVGYNHVPGARATSSSPDIATSVPKPTNGGKTYTFKHQAAASSSARR